MSDTSVPRQIEAQLVEALAARRGRATLGDVVRDTGLHRERTEQHLRALLSLYDSHLAVDEEGELLYIFDPAFGRREPDGGLSAWLARASRWGWKAFKVTFKVTVMVILVAYVVTFCVLIVAAVIAMFVLAQDGPDLDIGDVGVGDGCASGLGDTLFFWDPGTVAYVPLFEVPTHGSWRTSSSSHLPTGLREPHALSPLYVTDTYSKRRSRKKRFHDSVFDFIFGPALPDPPTLPDDTEVLCWIEDHRGVITMAELITRTGLSATAADQEMTRLLTRFGGDVEVSEEGHLLYTFHELRVTAGEEGRSIRPAPPAWHRFEPNEDLTGNKAGRNALIASMAIFTLAMAVVSPLVIFPILNIGGALAMAGLAVVPGLVGLLILAIPLARVFPVGAENKRRRARNVRRALLLVIFEHLSTASSPLPRARVRRLAHDKLAELDRPPKGASAEGRRTMEGLRLFGGQELDVALDQLLVDLDADIGANDAGEIVLSFPRLRDELAAADEARQAAEAVRRFGRVVFSSADELDAEAPAHEVSQVAPAEQR